MYRYARTKNRVHRVIVEGGKAFKIEQCNLDDAAFFRLEDITPEGQHCAYCWAGYVEPTPEEKAAKDEEVKQFTESPQAKAVPIVQSTRRMAAAVLVGALLLGAAVGVNASPKSDIRPDDTLAALRDRVDELVVQVRVLSINMDDHIHAIPSAISAIPPVVIVIPSYPPIDTQQVINSPSTTPVVPTPMPSADNGSTRKSSGSTDSGSVDTHSSTTTIIIVPAPTQAPVINPTGPTPPPQPTPPPAPTPTPCIRPGTALGAGDPCRWPHN